MSGWPTREQFLADMAQDVDDDNALRVSPAYKEAMRRTDNAFDELDQRFQKPPSPEPLWHSALLTLCFGIAVVAMVIAGAWVA